MYLRYDIFKKVTRNRNDIISDFLKDGKLSKQGITNILKYLLRKHSLYSSR